MRVEASVTTISWIPSDTIEGIGRLGIGLGIAHHDQPPPDQLLTDAGPSIDAALDHLRAGDRFRFANAMRAFAEFDEDGGVLDAGHLGGGCIGATRLELGIASPSVPAVMLPTLQPSPEIGHGFVRFRQTVGGRTGVPLPRPVKRPPFVQYRAPIVWTTLELALYADGRHSGRLVGASGFPRHWVFDDAGSLVAKSSLADYRAWAGRSYGERTPWGNEDSTVIVSEVESRLERELSQVIMRGGARPRLRRIRAGAVLVEQGAMGDELFLVLNGALTVEVDGAVVAELGPGAVIGERSGLSDGRRTATVRAHTDCRVAAVDVGHVGAHDRRSLVAGHRREGDPAR